MIFINYNKLILNFQSFSGSSVTVRSPSGAEKTALITGIDEYGFLKIQIDGSKKTESVQPDGNSFDMLRGLIIPK